MSFADRLQSLRKAAGISQVELARRADTPIDTLRKWEQGRNLPAIDAAARIAAALGCTLDELAIDYGPEKKPGTKPKKK